MIRTISHLSAAIFFLSGLMVAQAALTPVRVLAVANAHYPDSTFMRGEVSFEVIVDSDGSVLEIKPIHNVPPLTDAALQSLRGWKFAPAEFGGKPISSDISVAFVFCPGTPQSLEFPTTTAPLEPLVPAGEPAQLPVRIEQWTEARYPSWLRFGAVVLVAEVGPSGGLEHISVLRELGPGTAVFTAAARSALANWRFEAAKINGKAVEGPVAVAFVFGLPWPLAPENTPKVH